MIAAIIILSATVLFLAVSLGYCNTRRARAEMAYHVEKGTNIALQAQNETLVQQAGELYNAIQQERASHTATTEFYKSKEQTEQKRGKAK